MVVTRKDYFFKGVAPVCFAATCWAVVYFIRKFIANDLGVFTITFLSASAGTLFLYAVHPVKISVIYSTYKQRWKLITLMSVVSMTIGSTIFTIGLQHMDLSIALILERMQPIFTLLIAAIFLGERFAKVSILMCAIGIASSVGLIPFHGKIFSSVLTKEMVIGVSAVLGAALAWAISGVIGKTVLTAHTDSTVIALLRCLIGGVTAFPLMLFVETPMSGILPLWAPMVLACMIGIIGAGVGYIAYYYGLKNIPIGIASMLELVTPLVGCSLGIIFLHETMTLIQVLSSMVLLGSVSILVWVESKKHKALATVAIDPQS